MWLCLRGKKLSSEGKWALLILQNLLKICPGRNSCDLYQDIVARLEECVDVKLKNISDLSKVLLQHLSFLAILCLK